MTLFTLLIVMALERVVKKSRSWHIATISQQYFLALGFKNKNEVTTSQSDSHSSSLHQFLSSIPEQALMLLVAAIPALLVYILVAYLPGVLTFALYLIVLWVCLGCPVTRDTYKRYLQAANREDFEACALYSEKFGNQGGDLSNVGKQLVLVNYRQYAGVIIFFVVLGLPGAVFYSVAKEWFFIRKRQCDITNEMLEQDQAFELEANSEVVCEDATRITQTKSQTNGVEKESAVMLVLDWIPARLTAFGYLLVGHFSQGLPVWLASFGDYKKSAYDVLAAVAKASEDLSENQNTYLDEPLRMVKLVKRNIVFLLMLISIMTMTGAIT